jgi:hypothetical protein
MRGARALVVMAVAAAALAWWRLSASVVVEGPRGAATDLDGGAGPGTLRSPSPSGVPGAQPRLQLDRVQLLQRRAVADMGACYARTHMLPIWFAVPSVKIRAPVQCHQRVWASLVPGDLSTYVFSDEAAYMDHYASSWFGATWRKSGCVAGVRDQGGWEAMGGGRGAGGRGAGAVGAGVGNAQVPTRRPGTSPGWTVCPGAAAHLAVWCSAIPHPSPPHIHPSTPHPLHPSGPSSGGTACDTWKSWQPGACPCSGT